MLFLPQADALHGADTQRRIHHLRLRAAGAVLLLLAPWAALPLLPDGLPPELVASAVLVPGAVLLGLGILDAPLLCLGPLLRPLLTRLPADGAAVFDDGAWRLFGALPAHQRLDFEAAAARGGPRLAVVLLPRLLRLLQRPSLSRWSRPRLCAIRAGGWQAVLLVDSSEVLPMATDDAILCTGLPLLVERPSNQNAYASR